MKHFIAILIIWGWANHAYSQSNAHLAFFENLIEGKWEMKGEWSPGKTFRQVQVYSWGLNKTLVKVKTFGNTNPKTGVFGLRNEGIRAWDKVKKQLVFWEFDIFGGITQGTCTIKGNTLHYDYPYQGQNFRDSWKKIDKDTYAYKVGTVKNGQWLKVFISSTYKRLPK